MTTPIRIGLLRLVDSAPVVVADALGFFADLGLEVELSVEPSWANTMDKLGYGLLDAAVMLPPLALAAALGLRGPKVDLIVPMGLTQGGNAIVVGAGIDPIPGQDVVGWLQAYPEPPRFGVVHRFSTHNLLLRYWLALGGADPDRDIETVVVPPEQMVAALRDGRVTGFCAGAPWGDVAQAAGVGRVVLGTSSIWPFHPEKCLAVHGGWAAANGESLHLLIAALLRAQLVCDSASDAPEVARMLADPNLLSLPEAESRSALPGGNGVERIHFHAAGAWLPAIPHALWFLREMRRWGWIADTVDLPAVARAVYRPDILVKVLGAEGLGPRQEASTGGLRASLTEMAV